MLGADLKAAARVGETSFPAMPRGDLTTVSERPPCGTEVEVLERHLGRPPGEDLRVYVVGGVPVFVDGLTMYRFAAGGVVAMGAASHGSAGADWREMWFGGRLVRREVGRVV